MHTLLSWASTHTRTSAHPPPNLDFLRSSVQPPTILNSCVVNLNVGPLSSHSCDCSDALWAPWHQASKVCTHSVHGLVCSVLPLQHEIHVLQVMTECCRNLATRLWVGPLCSTIQLSPLSGWPRRSTDEVTMRYTLEANFVSGVDLCMEIIESFKQLLCATAHPQFLAPELRAAVGACPGQYSKCHS